MWVEIEDMLINLEQVIKIDFSIENKKLFFHTYENTLEIKFDSASDLNQAYFNLIEILHSMPVDGFRKR